MRADRTRALMLSLTLAALTLFTFLPATRNAFINYDDPDYITQNVYVQQGLSGGNIGWAFTTGHAGNYHPLTWISLMADRTLFGASACGFHTTNVLLHAANGVLLLLVLRAATGSTWRSALAAAIFALHPLRVESVAWATERKDVLSMFFALLTIGAYVRYAAKPGAGRYVLVAVMLELALLSKSTIVTLPAILLLMDFWPLRRVQLDATENHPLKRNAKQLVLEKLPLLGLSLIACTATLIAQSAGDAVGGTDKYPLLARIANAAIAYVTYLRKMLMPTDLAVFYPLHSGVSVWVVVCTIGALVAVTLIALRQRNRWPWLTVGWLWFLGALVPMIGLVQSGAQSMADRFTYLPMIGLVIVLAWAVPQAWVEAQRRRVAFAGVSTIALLTMFVVTREQLSHWRDSESLFTHALNVTSNNHIAHTNLAFELARQGKTSQAKAHYQAAIAISPTYSVAHNGLGTVFARSGNPAGAMREYGLAIQHNPRYALAHRNLAGQFALAKQMDLAIEHYTRAAELRPDDAATRMLAGTALAQAGRVGDAINHFKAAAAADPTDAQVQINLGRALVESNRPADALPALRHAIALDKKSAEARYYAGAALAQLGELDAAAAEFRHALAMNPHDAQAQAALDQVLSRLTPQRSASAAE